MRLDPTQLALVPVLSLFLVPTAPALGADPEPATGVPAPQAQTAPPPPGTVLIPGGRTRIGVDVRTIEGLIEKHEALRQNLIPLVTETPQHTVNVEPFFLMVNTVTNEQYLAFIEATGARPPHFWAEAAVEAGRAAFLEEQGKRRQEAQRAGEPLPAREVFDPPTWWRANWQGAEWKMPVAKALEPVVYINYSQAVEYARWAGMRLPTEQEFQRAVRGNTDRSFPWGDELERSRAATSELPGVRGIFPVASFPEGASEQGVHDLVGNVWEWTSSPFVAHPGYKDVEMRLGRGRRDREMISATSRFNANQRVTVGGNVHNSLLAARCTIRLGTERSQATDSLGFRCASSVGVGQDIAVTLLQDRVPVSIRPVDVNGPVVYVPSLAVAMDRWEYRDGSNHASASQGKSQASLPAGSEAQQAPTLRTASVPPEYAVITSYEHVVFVPAQELYAAGVNDVRETSLTTGPVHIGVLSSTLPILEPALDPGAYLVAIRGAGEIKSPRRAARDAGAPVEDQEEDSGAATPEIQPIQQFLPDIDVQVDNFIFYDMTGALVAFLPLTAFDWGNTTPSTTAIVPKTIIELHGEEGEEEEVEIQQTWYEQRIFLPGRGRQRGARITLPLRFEEGTLEGEWRRN